MKKYLSIILAAVLALCPLAGCAGQGSAQPPGFPGAPVNAQIMLLVENGPSDSSFTKDEYEKLLALRFDGYEKMTVAEFRDRVGVATDTEEYVKLFERISESEVLFEQKDTNEAAGFIFYTLMPLNDEQNWQTKAFSGVATSDSETGTALEYVYTLTITDENALTVREYNEAQAGITAGLQTFMDGKTAAELQNDTEMQAAISEEAARLTQLWGNENLEIGIEYSFKLGDSFQNETPDASGMPDSDTETRRAEYGTAEDYRSLLALKTADYADMSVADFDAKLLAWANEDFDRMERVDADTQWDDFRVDLSDEERTFVRLTVFLSGTENGEFIQSNYTNEPAADPTYNQCLPQKLGKENQQPLWCDLCYKFSYHIADKETLTVGERDRCVSGMIKAIQDFWDKTSLDTLLTMSESDIISRLASLADEYSSDDITITINPERVHFDHTDENAVRN